MTLGTELTPTLERIENLLWTMEAHYPNVRHEFPDEATSAACKILMAVLMDKMWDKQQLDKTRFTTRLKAAEWFGSELRNLIKQATGIETHDLYKAHMAK